MQTMLKIIAASLLTVILMACGSNQGETAPNQLSQLTTGIAPATKRTDFGQPASAETVAATAKELAAYFSGKNANNPQALTGASATSLSTGASSITAQPMIASTNVASAVYRFYNTQTSTHFYTMSVAERDYVQATFPQFNFEGISFYAYPATDPALSPVYRFFNKVAGTHFYTISAAEKDHVIATWPQIFNFEGISWYASTASQTSWIPVYRFFNTKTGAHFYTTNAGERDYVKATWNWFNFEGIAYYVRPDATPPITVPAPQPQNVKVYISAANTLPAGCNFTYEVCWANSVNNGTVLIINGGGQNYAYYKAGVYYVIRAIGSDGMLIHGSRDVEDYGVSAIQDWVMGTPIGIIKHQATDNTCWSYQNNQVTCPA